MNLIISYMLFIILQDDPIVIAPLNNYSTESKCEEIAKALAEKEKGSKFGCMPIGHKGV